MGQGRVRAELTDDQVALLVRIRDEGGCLLSVGLRGPDVIALMGDGLVRTVMAIVVITVAGRELLRRRAESTARAA